MKRFHKYTSLAITAVLAVFVSTAGISCSAGSSMAVIDEYKFAIPSMSKWSPAGEDIKNVISPWTVNGIESVPQKIFQHNDSGSIISLGTMLFDASRDIEEQVIEDSGEFAKIGSSIGSVNSQALESDGSVRIQQIAIVEEDSSVLARTVYYSTETEQALFMDLYSNVQALPYIKDDITQIMGSVSLIH